MTGDTEDETEMDMGDRTEINIPEAQDECCSYYLQGTAEIDRFIKKVSIRDRYRGRPFEYCPWCGAKK